MSVETIIPAPALLLRHGIVPLQQLVALLKDSRLEVFAPEELTAEWTAFACRSGGALIASVADPIDALATASASGIRGQIVLLIDRRYLAKTEILLRAGAALCLPLPLDRAAVDLIVAIVRSGPASHDGEHGGLVMEALSRIVRWRDRSVRLSPREFALLHALTRRHGSPVRGEQLVREVWNESGAPRSRQIVDVLVYQLRRRLHRLGLRGFVVTVRGVGYSVAPSAAVAAASVRCPPWFGSELPGSRTNAHLATRATP